MTILPNKSRALVSKSHDLASKSHDLSTQSRESVTRTDLRSESMGMSLMERGPSERCESRHDWNPVATVLRWTVESGRREERGDTGSIEVRRLPATTDASRWSTARGNAGKKGLTHHGCRLGTCATHLVDLMVSVSNPGERERKREREGGSQSIV